MYDTEIEFTKVNKQSRCYAGGFCCRYFGLFLGGMENFLIGEALTLSPAERRHVRRAFLFAKSSIQMKSDLLLFSEFMMFAVSAVF